MPSQLQEALRSLCNNTTWCYAIFWKLKQKVLEWEDGFCKPDKKLFSPSCFGTSWPCYLDDCIEMAVEKMACQSYPIGDGIVGQVACTDIHQWISSPRDIKELPTGWHEQFAAGIKTVAVISVHQGIVQLGSMEETSEDLNLVGHVKALFSRGLQISLERMDTLVIESRREKTHDKGSHTTVNNAITKRMPDISDLWSSLVERGRHVKDEQYLPSQLQYCETSLGLEGDTSTLLPIASQQQAEHASSSAQSCNELQQDDMQPVTSFKLLDDHDSDSIIQWSSSQHSTDNRAAFEQVTAKIMEPCFINQSIGFSIPDLKLPDMNCWQSINVGVAHKRLRYSLHTKSNVQLAQPVEAAFGIGCDTKQSVAMPPSIEATTQAPVLGVQVPDVANSLQHSSLCENSTNFLIEARNLDECSPSGTGCANYTLLQDAHTFDLFNSHDIRESEFADSSQTQNSSSVPCAGVDVQHSSAREPSSNDVLQRFFSRELYEFDNFIASLQNKEEVQSNEVTHTCPVHPDASETLSRSYGASFWDYRCFQHTPRSKHSATEELKEDMSTNSCQSTVENNILQMGTRLGETAENKFLHVNRYAETPNVDLAAFNNLEHETSYQGPQKLREVGLSTHAQGHFHRAGKKRTRQGGNSRPRPKDRQLIQDRVHELRSIIPSSQKCSIDALLDKTIKYLRYLQTVSEEAGICNDHSRLQVNGEGDDGSNIKEAGGATWVMELGGHGRDYPLFVEDLKQPHHMLVEMLCEEKELFLEIAKTLKGLGLRILKGLMELRNEKMWARWVIKGNEQVHRVQIMWALMHLVKSSTRAASSITASACG